MVSLPACSIGDSALWMDLLSYIGSKKPTSAAFHLLVFPPGAAVSMPCWPSGLWGPGLWGPGGPGGPGWPGCGRSRLYRAVHYCCENPVPCLLAALPLPLPSWERIKWNYTFLNCLTVGDQNGSGNIMIFKAMELIRAMGLAGRIS